MKNNKIFKTFLLSDDKQSQYGIIASQADIALGSLNLNSYLSDIKILSRTNVQDTPELPKGIYWVLLFGKHASQEFVESMCILFNSQVHSQKNITIEAIIKRIEAIFKIKKEQDLKHVYKTKISELAFIKKCLSFNVNTFPFYKKDTNKLNFHFPKNQNLGLVFTDNENENFYLSQSQLESINNCSKNELVVININWDSEEGVDLKDLLEDIRSVIYYEVWTEFKKEITEIYNSSPDLFVEYKINLNKTEFLFYDKTFLPKIQCKFFYNAIGEECTTVLDYFFKITNSTNTVFSNFEERIETLINE
ncbi:hypothetical protein [Ureaplasma ceti]|uniref:Uncharacterized protein n=1 Tax=Ureaplasma ceti TaxID=3119530 RepID=A0ABP9U6G5_9BACT